MAINDTADWTAQAVAQAVLNSGKSKAQVATEAAIPERTFFRKLRNGSGGFSWEELLRLSEVLNVSPSKFTPPAFRGRDAA